MSEVAEMVPQISERALDEADMSYEVLSLEELCKKEGIERVDLPDKLQEKADKEVVEIEKHINIPGAEDLDFYHFLYNCYLGTRELSENDPLNEFGKSLDSYESFLDKFMPETSIDVRSNFVQRMYDFISYDVHPEDIIMVYSPDDFRRERALKGYNRGGKEWIKLPDKYIRSSEYVSRDVLIEVAELEKNGGYPTNSYYHSTGTAALDRVIEHQAILSSDKVASLGRKPVTGETMGYGKGKLLHDVYVDASHSPWGYRLARWFDEYGVAFSIDRDKIEEYIKEKGIEDRPYDWGSEGILLGPEVPLNTVNAIFTNHENLDEMKKWAEENCPEAKVISFEAFDLYRENEKIKKGESYFSLNPIDWSSI